MKQLKKIAFIFFIFVLAFQVPAEAKKKSSNIKVRIAVVDTHNGFAMVKSCEAIKAAGGTPVRIKTTKGSVESLNLDGLYLPGGPDIAPSYYGQKRKKGTVSSARCDKLQFKWLDRFVKAGKPVYGACRGIQVINVYFGGTLNQNIRGHTQTTHKVTTVKGTWCRMLLGKTQRTNSNHHQCIKKVGTGLIVCARKGRVVEAIRHKTLPIYGSQFHPEYRNPGNFGKKVMKYWVGICKRYKKMSMTPSS